MSADQEPPTRRPAGRLRRRAVLIGVAVAVVVGIAALAGLWEVSGSPRFCSTCHIMLPYVQGWQASKHAPIACVQCHYPPGFRDTIRVKFAAMTQVAKWATGTYSSKPFAEVEDASCLRSGCHAQAVLDGTGGSGPASRGVRFSHRIHLDGAKTHWQLRCTSCHSQIVVNRHFEIDRRSCFVCHFKGSKEGRELTPIAGCTGCHEPPTADIIMGPVRFSHRDIVQRGVACQKCHLSVVEGEGEAPRERCLGCHNQAEKLERHRDLPALHDIHVTRHPIECVRCHSEIKHRLPPPIGSPAAEGSPAPSGARS